MGAQSDLRYGYKDYPEAGFENAVPRDSGVWAQAYGDYERHSNLNPGQTDNPTSTQRSVGIVSGIDRTFRDSAAFGQGSLQLGLLGGYNSTRTSFSDTPNNKDASQRDEGSSVGAYGSYVVNRFALDFLVKGDFYNHSQSATVTQTSTVSCKTGQLVTKDSGRYSKCYSKNSQCWQWYWFN